LTCATAEPSKPTAAIIIAPDVRIRLSPGSARILVSSSLIEIMRR
jgi:hypothetical protein